MRVAFSGLPKDSVVNVTALVSLDKTDLDPRDRDSADRPGLVTVDLT